ncbi:HAMP domain-containing sensor histidine kinase [Mycolicibacterium sp. S3B2]|uniref:sensor histidine kinase n=1 Tax=Mycolicibacterium sp. S3B2 TaxID=3415120 RepID=UPI003C7B90C9
MKSADRPSRVALSNWPVRWKVLAIAAVPLILAGVFGGLRIHSSVTEAGELQRAAERAEMVPAIADYMGALEQAMVTATQGGDTGSALTVYGSARSELERRVADTDLPDSTRLAANTLLDYGQDLLDGISANTIDLRGRVKTYAPLLLTAETAITGLVDTDDQAVQAEGDALARAVGARGQMAMQQMLVTSGGGLPEPELRSAMITIAGTEPSTVSAMGGYFGGATDQAASLRSEMVRRMSMLSDPASVLVGNPDLLASQQVTRDIADGLIAQTTHSIPATVNRQAADARTAAIRDAALVGAAIVVALLLVTLVARTLVRPLRTLRDSALKVAHEDLAREVEHVRTDGKTFPVQPVPVHTSEEVGQVAHAVDELHEQAVLLAGEQARLQLQVTDMFETLSRRNRTLVDQQLSLIDQLERDEEDPDRLQSLFRLDHLAARMRRNGANLMVLAGARIPREQAEPVALTAVVNAAASEVEDYTRVEPADLPDTEVSGAVAGDLVHLLAELLDNALRYSPPANPVRVSAVHTGNGGLVVEVSDTGLGMTESDLRVANTRLESGGEVNPYTARHMGLFVVGRLAMQHGLVVRLRSTTATREPGAGTTAGVYVPATLLATRARRQPAVTAAPAAEPAALPAVAAPAPAPRKVTPDPATAPAELPRRRPGSSRRGGVSGPAGQPVPPQRSDVAAFFAPRPERIWSPPVTEDVSPPAANGDIRPAQESPVTREVEDAPVTRVTREAEDAPVTREAEVTGTAEDDDAIYQKMLSEWLVDPHELSQNPDLNWKSVWDHGWSAAAAAEKTPVSAHTVDGLPVRQPGARLVPGAAGQDSHHHGGHPVASPVSHDRSHDRNGNDTGNSAGNGAHGRHLRDPDAVRTSIGRHFGGVHAARAKVQETGGAHVE